MEFSHITDQNANWYSHFGTQMAINKVQCTVTLRPRYPTPRCSQWNKNLCLHKNLYISVYSTFIHNYQELEKPKFSLVSEQINCDTAKNGIQLSNKMGQSTDWYMQQHGWQVYCAKWKKPN